MPPVDWLTLLLSTVVPALVAAWWRSTERARAADLKELRATQQQAVAILQTQLADAMRRLEHVERKSSADHDALIALRAPMDTMQRVLDRLADRFEQQQQNHNP